ncbi:MAG TPA: LamG-like jellyroll fold domain-containing protein [Polyangia bacterium]
MASSQRSRWLARLAGLALLLVAVEGHAATVIWGGGTGTWGTAANWVGGSAPTASDTVAFKGWAPLSPSGWTLTASGTSAGDDVSYAVDGRRSTRWGVGSTQSTDDWFKIDMGSNQTVSRLEFDTGPDYPTQYPRGYNIEVSTNNSSWTSVATGAASASLTTIDFDEQTVRYIRIKLTTTSTEWWCIAELTVWSTSASGATRFSRGPWTASASVTEGGRLASHAIDSDLTTRWSTGALQNNTQWFKVDLGSSLTFTAISLDAYSSTSDYPRTFTIAVSTNDSTWTTVQSGITLAKEYTFYTFSAQTARYIRIWQTGSSGSNYWSIHDFNVYGTPTTANIAATTSIAELQISRAVTVTQAAGQNLTITGDFTLAGGTYTGGTGNLLVGGDFIFSSGTFTAPSELFRVGSTYNQTGGTYTHNSGRLLLNATGARSFVTNGSSFNSVFINDGLIGYWPFEETATASSDFSGWGRTATWYNSADDNTAHATTAFANDRSLAFSSASNSYATIADSPDVTQMSISVWAYSNSRANTFPRIIDMPAFELSFTDGSQVAPQVSHAVAWTGTTSGTAASWRSEASSIGDGAWYHIVATMTSAGAATIYINGVSQTLSQPNGAPTGTISSNAGTGHIGNSPALNRPWNGYIDDLRIYDRILTAADAKALYYGGQRTAANGSQTLNGALTTASNLVIASGALDVSATNCSSAPCAVTVAGSFLNYGGDFTPRTGTVTLNGTGGTSVIRSDRDPFYNLTISNTGSWTLKDRLYVSNLLTMSANGTLATSTYPLHAGTVTKSTGTLSGTGALVLDSTSSQSLTLNSAAVPVRIESPKDDGLIGYWKFDDGRGSTVTDHSGNGNHATVANDAVWTTDVPSGMGIDDAGAMVFNGTNQYATIGTPAVLNISGQITMAAWVKFSATDGFRNILTHGSGDSPDRDTFLRIADGNYRVGTWYSPTDTYASYTVGSDSGNWVHLVGVNDGTTWRLYRNGVQVATQAGAAGAYVATANWRIGAQGSSESRFFAGSIDDVRIYNRGLSANEVAALYAYGYTSGSTAVYSLAANATMTSTFKIDSGVLDAVSYSNAITDAATINGGTYIVGSHTSGQTFTGGLAVNRYGKLHLLSSGGKALFGSASILAMDGTLYATNTGAVIEAVGTNTFYFRVGSVSGATPVLNISGLQVKETTADGMYVNHNTGASTTFTKFDNIAFTNGAGTGSGNYNLSIYATALYLTSNGCSFDGNAAKSVAKNVRLMGNGITAGSETRAIFGGATCASSVTCESYDADDDAADDGTGDTTASDGAVVQWVQTAGTDTAGTIEGFPTAAFDWNNFTYYATYVAYHDTSGTADTVYARSSTGTASYSWSTSSGEDIIGTPRWDTVSSVHYVYVATTGGKVYRLIDNGTTLAKDTVSPWDGANNPYDCSCTITTPLAQDTSNLYWGGNASGTHKLWTLSKTSTTRLPNGAPLATSTTTNNAAPALWVSGSTYVYLGLAGRVSKVNVSTQANVADNTNPASTNPVTGRITVVDNALYAGDDNGYLWKLDPGTNFAASSGLYKHWGYKDTTNHAACGGVCQVKSHYYDPTATNVYFGDQDGHLYVINSSGSAKTGYPYRPGTSSDVFTTAPFHRSGVIVAGTTTGTLYIIDQSTNGTTPGLIRKYQFGATTKVSGIAYNPNVTAYMVSTADDTNKDGKLYYIDRVSDPTSTYP